MGSAPGVELIGSVLLPRECLVAHIVACAAKLALRMERRFVDGNAVKVLRDGIGRAVRRLGVFAERQGTTAAVIGIDDVSPVSRFGWQQTQKIQVVEDLGVGGG